MRPRYGNDKGQTDIYKSMKTGKERWSFQYRSLGKIVPQKKKSETGFLPDNIHTKLILNRLKS